MKKYIVLSVNDNPEYLFYLPLTVWAWRKFGWEAIVFKPSNPMAPYPLWLCILKNIDCQLEFIHQWEEYSSEMLAQVSRLYAACIQDGYLMTGDVDMIPLSNYWKFDEDAITSWGHDLTDYNHNPICYIGMKSELWRKIMNLDSRMYSELIKRDLDSAWNSKSDNAEERWCVDQDIITHRLTHCGIAKTIVERGTYQNGYPIGRVDRSAWTLEHEQLIDCHMLRGIWKNEEHKRMTMELLHKVWPEEDFTWFEKYIEEFKKQVNG